MQPTALAFWILVLGFGFWIADCGLKTRRASFIQFKIPDSTELVEVNPKSKMSHIAALHFQKAASHVHKPLNLALACIFRAQAGISCKIISPGVVVLLARGCCRSCARSYRSWNFSNRARLLSTAIADADEVYLVELFNRARENPDAEAARYGIDLNEGLRARYDQRCTQAAAGVQ